MQDTKKQKLRTGNIIDLVLLKRVLRFAKPYRLQFFIAAISAIMGSMLFTRRID